MVKAREFAQVSQERMAELLGCSRRTIVRYETAGAQVPPGVLLAYHVGCAVDLEWLYSGSASWEGGESPWYSNRYTPRDLNPEPTDSGKATDAIVTHIDLAPSLRLVAYPKGGKAA